MAASIRAADVIEPTRLPSAEILSPAATGSSARSCTSFCQTTATFHTGNDFLTCVTTFENDTSSHKLASSGMYSPVSSRPKAGHSGCDAYGVKCFGRNQFATGLLQRRANRCLMLKRPPNQEPITIYRVGALYANDCAVNGGTAPR